MNAESLSDLLPALREYAELPESVKEVLRKNTGYTFAGRSGYGQ